MALLKKMSQQAQRTRGERGPDYFSSFYLSSLDKEKSMCPYRTAGGDVFLLMISNLLFVVARVIDGQDLGIVMNE
jgi:hypothetical protein